MNDVAPYVMRCRCGTPLRLVDMYWYTPPRPQLSVGPIRQVCCQVCARADRRAP